MEESEMGEAELDLESLVPASPMWKILPSKVHVLTLPVHQAIQVSWDKNTNAEGKEVSGYRWTWGSIRSAHVFGAINSCKDNALKTVERILMNALAYVKVAQGAEQIEKTADEGQKKEEGDGK